MSSYVLFIADLHIGSSVALCHPSAQLDDGGTYQLSRGQWWLWDKWERLLDRVKPLHPWTVINGDAVEIDAKGRSYQLVTPNPASIKAIAKETVTPLANLSAGVFFIRGTMAHGGKSAEAEEDVAANFDNAVKCPENGRSSWWGLKWECEGVRFDIAHHPVGSGGGRPFNRNSMIDRLASDTEFQYCEARETPPDLVIRSHIHQYRDSFDHFRVRAICTPAWTLASEYIHKIAPHALADIGAVLVACDAGKYEVEVIRFEPMHTPFFTPGEVKFDGNDRD